MGKVLLDAQEVEDFKNKSLCFGTEYSDDASDCDIKSCPDTEKCKALHNGAEYIDTSKADAGEVFDEVDKPKTKTKSKSKVKDSDNTMRAIEDKDSASEVIGVYLKERGIKFDVATTATRDKFITEDGVQILVAGKRSVKFCSLSSGDELGLDKDVWNKTNVGFDVKYEDSDNLNAIVESYLDKIYGDTPEVEKPAEPKEDMFEGVEEEEEKTVEERLEEIDKIKSQLRQGDEYSPPPTTTKGVVRVDEGVGPDTTVFAVVEVIPENLKQGVGIYKTTDGLLQIRMIVRADEVDMDEILKKVREWLE